MILKMVLLLLTTLSLQSLIAQTGTGYVWVDSLQITSTEIDCSFVKRWEDVVIWSDVKMLLKVGSPDTTNWSSRKYITLEAGKSLFIGQATRLPRFSYKSFTASDTGYVQMIGRKKVRQQ